ncbi:DNA methyltransferase [Streptomyces sp. MBT54]|uniref:DNA methyltransferase n=1 Tax=Streptomyces sp. MBT54 TaxID=1488385 RepID=UPI001F269BE1|nr:DNA methyltransferase [Streptomyces sp. MBT54]
MSRGRSRVRKRTAVRRRRGALGRRPRSRARPRCRRTAGPRRAPPGGLVLDPFAGSGTTGVAALAEGPPGGAIWTSCRMIDSGFWVMWTRARPRGCEPSSQPGR